MKHRMTQLALGISALVFAASPAMADVIKQQDACAPICLDIPHNVANAVFTARTFSFNAPRRGTAIVSFNGESSTATPTVRF